MELPEIDIINEFNNYYFIECIKVINDVIAGKITNYYDVKKEISSRTNDTKYYFGQYTEELLKCNLTENKSINKKNNFNCKLKDTVPIPFSLSDKIYIKSVLKSKYAKIFFDGDEINNILDKFKDIPDISFEKICVPSTKIFERDLSLEEISNIRLLVKAIRQKNEIKYSNKARNGTLYIDSKGFPIKIEFSVLHNKFYLSLWNSKESRPIKINIYTMYDIELTDNILENEFEPVEMMKSKYSKEPIRIEVKNKNNATERVRKTFSMYNTEIFYDKNIHIMNLYYYNYDEADIINKIIAFGPRIKVISPPEIVDKIKKRIIDITTFETIDT